MIICQIRFCSAITQDIADNSVLHISKHINFDIFQLTQLVLQLRVLPLSSLTYRQVSNIRHILVGN